MERVMQDTSHDLIGLFLQRWTEIQTLRGYATSGLFTGGPLPQRISSSPQIMAYLTSNEGLETVRDWVDSFDSTIESFDAAVAGSNAGLRFERQSWRLGIEAAQRTVGSLVTRLQVRARKAAATQSAEGARVIPA